jgi:hypothetical protein
MISRVRALLQIRHREATREGKDSMPADTTAPLPESVDQNDGDLLLDLPATSAAVLTLAG